MVELCCVSVPGGWQTCIKGTVIAFGPVFNVIGDLWKWQRENVYTTKQGLRDLLVKCGYSLPVNYFNSIEDCQYDDIRNSMIYTVTIRDESGISEYVTEKVEVTYHPGQVLVAEFM